MHAAHGFLHLTGGHGGTQGVRGGLSDQVVFSVMF